MKGVTQKDITASIAFADDAILHVQLVDYEIPGMAPGDYTFRAVQTLNVDGNRTFEQPPQHYRIRAPRFFLDSSTIHATYPAPGSQSDVSTALPHITVARPMLAWERHIDGSEATVEAPPIPWMAVLVFTLGEIIDDPEALGLVSERTVGDFLRAPEPGVLVPTLTISDDSEYDGSCHTIDVPAEVMRAIAPTLDDLPLLAHIRHVRHPDQRTQSGDVFSEGDFTVIVANRFPRTTGPYVAHLVSFEGFSALIASGFPVSGTLRLCSLAHWAFTCQTSSLDPAAILQNLVAPGGDGLALRSPKLAPGSGNHVIHANARLERGYVSVPFVTLSGEQTFAWYRGPFIPYTARPLPDALEGTTHSSSDHALIFNDTDYGMFDISYASAWMLGRTMTLMAPDTRQALTRTRRRLRNTAAYLLTAAENNQAWSGLSFSPVAALERIGRKVEEERIRALLPPSGLDIAEPSSDPTPVPAPAEHAASPAQTLGSPQAQAQLLRAAEPFAEEIAAWLDRLSHLYGVAFNMLVPDPDALPEESLRFFLIDPAWMSRFLAGAKDTAAATETDALVQPALDAALAASMEPRPQAGMLMHSELVPVWPNAVIVATDAQGTIPELRRALLAPNILLVLFARAPVNVDIVENSEGIHHGTPLQGFITLRNAQTGVGPGARFPPTGTIFERYLRAVSLGKKADVLKVGGSDGIAKALADATQSQGHSKDLALQLIVSSIRQRITVSTTTRGRK
ncbi:MAG TPA: hypothetical protein VIM98_01765 [Dyella sp.]|uniref:hypothetical protein n=1 Tax=Dyella sp. TaxID=1869338 RepID=UPI002F92F50C